MRLKRRKKLWVLDDSGGEHVKTARQREISILTRMYRELSV
jgi:hypothetical protein